MTCKTESKHIGDHEYSVTQWSAKKAMVNKMTLIKVFGSSIASIATMVNDESDEDIKSEAVSKAINNIFMNTEPEQLVDLITDFIKDVGCDGQKLTSPKIEELFSGDDLLEIYMVFIFVIKVNYGNLLKGQLLQNILAKVA